MNRGQYRGQQNPINRGVPVTENLIKWLKDNDIDEDITLDLLIKRDAFGRAKYGQPLMSLDGRDSVQDAEEEIGDLLQYTFKAIMNKQDVSRIKTHVRVLCEMLDIGVYNKYDCDSPSDSV